jgi:hypothetical protein
VDFEGYKHIKSKPFWTWWHVTVSAAMIQLCKGWDFARSDAVAIGEEGIRPLLEETID